MTRWLLIFATLSTMAQADESHYRQCIGEHISDAELDQAVVAIKQACYQLHMGGIKLPRETARLQCRVEKASRAKTDLALQELLQYCDEEHDFKRSSGK